MNENFLPLLIDGTIITVVGMLVVFGFLTIMVFVMQWTSNFVLYLNEKFPPEVKVETTKKKKTVSNDDEAIAVAIAVARAQRA